ncbi:hypothetical protein JKP88DRAFT_314038 [Tribonema minus]|uniref:Amine oxidase domain-containing protein n=1 Tax=Tribonema minus TaxID=303371 RepID=A0A835Z7G4_9STRA|nr:hypothetical protein JKP88DRAFT_314038 [Tribonema minus]
MEYAQRNLDVGWPNFIAQQLSLNGMPQFALASLLNSPFEAHHKQLQRRFKSPKLQAMLSFQDLYVGLTPYSAPAVFSLLQAIELNEGVYYPVGGFHKVAKGLLTICRELGVKFKFNSAVDEILVGGKIYAYELQGGELLQSDVIVANADLPYVELNLLPEQFRRKGLGDAEYSSGVVAFYWGCDRQWPQLAHHTVFLSTDYAGSWDRVFKQQRMGSGGFNFYCAAASRTDPSVCPEGHDAIMVLVPCPLLPPTPEGGDSRTQAGGRDWDAEVAQWMETARKGVLQQFEEAAGMAGFADSIRAELVYTPRDWQQRYSLERGAAFGLAHSLNQLAIFRPSPRHPNVDDLYFVGASTRPGNGLPLVLTGARLVADDVVARRPDLFARDQQ